MEINLAFLFLIVTVVPCILIL